MKKALKTVAINCLILLVLLVVVDFCSMIILDLNKINNKVKNNEGLTETIDVRGGLTNYKNTPWAKIYFQEFHNLPSEYKSYYGWRRTKFTGKTINIDSFGIRKTTNVTNSKSPVVVFLGGSTMFGSGSDDNNTIPSLFSQKIKGKYQVVNYGETGYNSYQSLIFLQTQMAKGLLDSINVIITYDGVNNTKSFKNYFSHHREEQIQKSLKGIDTKHEYMFCIIQGHLISKIKSRYTTKIIISESKLYDKQTARELLESWLIMRTFAEVNNADFVCILQPNIFVGNPNITNIENDIDYSYKGSFKYYKYVNKFIDENERYKVLKPHFIDMTNVFDNVPDVYIDFCHVSPNGSEIIADNILEYLK